MGLNGLSELGKEKPLSVVLVLQYQQKSAEQRVVADGGETADSKSRRGLGWLLDQTDHLFRAGDLPAKLFA